MYKQVQKIIKPKISIGILFTLISMAPYLHLLFDIATENYENIMKEDLLCFPLLIFIGVYWSWHVLKIKRLKKDVEDILSVFNEDDDTIHGRFETAENDDF